MEEKIRGRLGFFSPSPEEPRHPISETEGKLPKGTTRFDSPALGPGYEPHFFPSFHSLEDSPQLHQSFLKMVISSEFPHRLVREPVHLLFKHI